MQAKLSPSQFRTFKACSADLASGNTTPQRYHATIVKLGLATSIPQLVQFCPSDIRRSQVMAAHQEYINFGALPLLLYLFMLLSSRQYRTRVCVFLL